MRGEWEGGARQFPGTGELRHNGHEVERREVEAAVEQAVQRRVTCILGALQDQLGLSPR